jgi:hypothetical protein
MTDRNQLLKLLDEAVERLKVLHRGHWEAAKRYKRYSRALGLPVVALTTVTGTALFTNLESSGHGWQIAAGILALIAAVLAAIQTFLNYEEQAGKHLAATPKWGALRRKAELLLAAPPESVHELKEALTAINEEWTEIEGSVPELPPRVFRRTEKYYETQREPAENEGELSTRSA